MQDSEARAVTAGLVYIQDFASGLSRKKCGKGFRYLDVDGNALKCATTRNRVTALVIPPAWKDVWICTDAEGHIQATGIDDAGRKQYIYHAKWHEASALHKYGRLRLFASLLPMVRRRVQKDLKNSDLCKERVVAAVVRLLDKACIRIGNRQYLESNDSRGATTLTSDHVCRHSHDISLSFKGKSGKQIELKCHDEGLASVIEDCEKSDGEFLFSYENDAGDLVAVTSSDVNSYLFETAKNTITAKDFRTWRGSVVALTTLSEMGSDLSKTATKKIIVEAVKSAASVLANTTAVCRRSYIHSAILSKAESGELARLVRKLKHKDVRLPLLSDSEKRLVAFLAHLEDESAEKEAPTFSKRVRKAAAA